MIGTVKFRNELLIDGEVEGKIDSAGRLTIGKNARIRGEIRTKSVIVEGNIDGNITARERCRRADFLIARRSAATACFSTCRSSRAKWTRVERSRGIPW
ncbi:MAG: hypothetical protein DME36_12565 [Verrucomicrobia bacterium]|nr:MAG: hypothetical protein DME36_12565 [Verrucomicrobiota bacterium]